jgi:hypothetical protein
VKHLAQRAEITGVDQASDFWFQDLADHVAFLTLTLVQSNGCGETDKKVTNVTKLQRGGGLTLYLS